MSPRITDLITQWRQAPVPEWRGGSSASHRPLSDAAGAIPLAGVYSPWRPQAIQVLGRREIEQLERADDQSRAALFQTSVRLNLLADVAAPNWLSAAADRHQLPLLGVALDEQRLLPRLQRELWRLCSARQQLHAVLMELFGTGMLITGAPGSGKSSLALELLDRGHRLVADDRVELYVDGDGRLAGHNPSSMPGFLFVRGLGVVDVAAGYGATALCRHTRIGLGVELRSSNNAAAVSLLGDTRAHQYLGHAIPTLAIRPASTEAGTAAGTEAGTGPDRASRAENHARRQVMALHGDDVAARFEALQRSRITLRETRQRKKRETVNR